MDTILLLHGAAGASTQLEPLAEKLKDSFNVILFNFSGHGGKPVPPEPFSIELFADEVLNLINKGRLNGINIYGYSMGGYTALYLARNFPEKVNKIFTTATKFSWDETSAEKESRLLNPEKIVEKVPVFADMLSRLHYPENWKTVLKKTAEMMINLGKDPALNDEDFSKIENEILLSVGDRDNMVSAEETIHVYRLLKNGQLFIIPDTGHPFEKISAGELSAEIKSFFSDS